MKGITGLEQMVVKGIDQYNEGVNNNLVTLRRINKGVKDYTSGRLKALGQ